MSSTAPRPESSALTSARPARAWAGIALAALLFVISAASFLPLQSLWVDETTQLSGIALDPARLLPWLLGHGPDLGVPPDRMPPGAYLLGMAWASIAGLTEPSLRWMGVACTLIGLLATAAAARRAYGAAAGVGAALFLALSPNVLVFAVEIRAYPAFLMLAGIAMYSAVRAFQAEPAQRTRWLAVTTAVLIAAAYVHFFGLVFAVALGTALLVDALRRRRPLWPLLACAGVFVLAFAGVVPFVLAAARQSGGGAAGAAGVAVDPLAFVKLLYRLYGHPALATSLAMTLVASLGIALAAAVALFARGPREPVRVGVAVTAAAGLSIVCAAAFVAHGFATTSPSYNVWLLPVLALLLSRALSGAGGRWAQRAGALGFALLLAGSAYASWQIHRLAPAYAHGPQNALFALLGELGPQRVDIVYDIGADDASGHVSFPVRYRYGRGQPQYRFDEASARLGKLDSKDPVPEQPSRDTIVVLRLENTPASELARRLRELPAAPATLPASQWLAQRGWQRVGQRPYVGLVSAQVDILQRPH